MICLPYTNPDSFGCDNKTDLGRLTGKHQWFISPSAALLARHDSSGGDASSPPLSLVSPKPDLGRLTAKHQCNVIPSAVLSARHDSIGSDASSLSLSAARFQYISHAWSRNMGFVCGCTSSEQTENVLTSVQRASAACQNRRGLDASDVNLSSENHISGMSPSQQTTSSGSSTLNEAFVANSFPWQGNKSGSYFHAKVGIEVDQDHFRYSRQMSEAAHYAHVESDGFENGSGSQGISSHVQDEHVTQHSLKSESDGFENGYESHGISSHAQDEPVMGLALMDGRSYVDTTHPESQTVVKEMRIAREEPNNDTDNISVVRLPAYRTSYSNWPSKFTESIFYLESMGVDTGKLIREEPSAVMYDIIRLRELVRALEVLGLHWKDLGKIFNLCPRIIHLSPEKDLKLVTDFLSNEAGLDPKDFSKVIKRCPRLLGCDVVNQLFPTLAFLRTLGFSNMGQVISNNATLLSLNVEKNLVPKLKYLEGLGFTHRQAVSMVVRFPALFNYKVKDNLEPKYEYLVHEMGGSNRDLLAFPQYFGYSLANRIIPRNQCITKLNVSLSLQAMLKLSEAEFYARFYYLCEQGPSSKQETSGLNGHDCALEFAKFESLTYPRTTPILVGTQW